MMTYQDIEASVKSCYATWSTTYFDEYYGLRAPYPPLHRELFKNILRAAHAKKVLDAGCGPASLLRELFDMDMDLYGFDLTPEMVAEARRVFAERGLPPERIWEGSILDPASFRIPEARGRCLFDAIVSSGVFPHIPETADKQAITNMRNAVKRGGVVAVEARNQLFALFTLNRYSYDFFMNDLIQGKNPSACSPKFSELAQNCARMLQQHFRMDIPKVRKGKAGEPGYDEVLSRTHNPIVLRELFLESGFKEVRLLFYHYHCLPPLCEAHNPEVFRAQSLAMENPTDWRGYFMASAFIITGKKS